MIDYNGLLYGSIEIVKFKFIYLFCYGFLDLFMNNSSSYINLQKHKQMYILKNIIKSVSMFIIFICSLDKLYIYFINDNFNNQLVRKFGAAYVANDLLALLIVDKLPDTTIIHHKLTVTFFYILCAFDINQVFVLKLLVLYTFFSYCAFMVNLYLGLRYFITENETGLESKMFRNLNIIIDRVRVTAYFNYLICCGLNWSIHFLLLLNRYYSNLLGFYEIIYCLMLIPIIKDDIILLSWLEKKYKN